MRMEGGPVSLERTLTKQRRETNPAVLGRRGTCHSEERGQAEQGGGLLEGRGAVSDALLDERQAV